MKTRRYILSLVMYILIVSCSGTFKDDTKPNMAKVVSVDFTMVNNAKAHSPSNAKVLPASSYDLGYQQGCADASRSLTQSQNIIPPGTNMEDYYTGYYTGYKACLPATVPSPTPAPPGGGGDVSCVSFSCQLVYNTTDSGDDYYTNNCTMKSGGCGPAIQ